jgi:hypothetical protein
MLKPDARLRATGGWEEAGTFEIGMQGMVSHHYMLMSSAWCWE